MIVLQKRCISIACFVTCKTTYFVPEVKMVDILRVWMNHKSWQSLKHKHDEVRKLFRENIPKQAMFLHRIPT